MNLLASNSTTKQFQKSLHTWNFIEKTAQRFQKNMLAFQNHIPNIANFFEKYIEQQFSITLTDDERLNILCKTTSLVIYPIPAKQYIYEHMKKIELLELASTPNRNHKALIISGIGLGYHLTKLVEKVQPNFLLIYEPQNDFLKASLYSAPWFELLTYCQIHHIQVFIQHGNSAVNLKEDLKELSTTFPNIGNFYTYRHLSNDILDKQLCELGLLSPYYVAATDLHPFLALPTSKKGKSVNNDEDSLNLELLQKNLTFFLKYEPKLYQKLFSVLQAHQYRLENILLTYLGTNNLEDFLIYSTPSPEAELANIYKDPVIYGLTLSKKNILTPFLTLVNNIRNQIELCTFEQKKINLGFSEIALLGVLDKQACNNAAELADKLIIVEQSTGRFLISCFMVPWNEIATKKKLFWLIDEGAERANLEKLYQRHDVSLVNCYMFQPYYTKDHCALYQKFLESIQSTNGKSNFFEKQYHAISRARMNAESYRYAFKKTTKIISVPIFIIGNGPSLENELITLKSIKHKVVLISCGTALTTLHNKEITPDIHIELEKEYDTLVRLQRLPTAYLKKITLWATSDILPKISELFSTCLLHSVSLLKAELLMYSQAKLKPLVLDYSYYTVTNFALDIILQRRCNNIYLIGVDFGFPSLGEHHARSSEYFNHQGKSRYDYEMVHGATFEVPGNLGENCLTVPAFQIARELMQKGIESYNKKLGLFNVGPGAKINGAIPLAALEAVNFTSLKTVNKPEIFTEYEYLPTKELQNTYNDAIEHSANVLDSIITLWSEALHQQINNRSLLLLISTQRMSIDRLIEESISTYGMLDGSVRYFESIFHRYIMLCMNNNFILSLIAYWVEYLKSIRIELGN